MKVKSSLSRAESSEERTFGEQAKSPLSTMTSKRLNDQVIY